MAHKILIGNDGTYGSPVTHSDFVFFDDGESLTEKMDVYNIYINDLMYPVGRVIETTGDFNPNGHYPGVWHLLEKNHTVISAGSIALQEKESPMELFLPDGSVWDLIYHHEIAGGYWASTADCLDFDLNATKQKFGKMKYVNNYYNANDTLEFLMVYNVPYGGGVAGEVTNMGRWVQHASPFSAGNAHRSAAWNKPATVDGYNATTTFTAADGTTVTNTDINAGLYVPWTANNWTGLSLSRPSNAYFAGNHYGTGWFYAIGSTAAHNGGIPAHIAATACTLYVRKDNAILANLENGGYVYGEEQHLLTVDEMAYHDHRLYYTRTGNFTNLVSDNGQHQAPDNYYTGPRGGSQAHNNMQPSIYVNLWERIS